MFEKESEIIDTTIKILMAEKTDYPFYLSVYETLKQATQHMRNTNITVGGIADPDFEFKMGGLSFSEISTHVAGVCSGINMAMFSKILYKFEELGVIERENPLMTFRPIHSESAVRFKITETGMYLGTQSLIKSAILGFPYIIEHYRESIAMVLGKNKYGDQVCGTGFIAKLGNKNAIITCKHCVENISELRFEIKGQTIGENEVQIHCSNIDFLDCVIITGAFETYNPLIIEERFEILQDVITMGYPSIPRSKDSYLIIETR